MFSLVKVFLLVILGQVCLVHSQYQIPEVTLEAFSPSGFRASIRADPGVEFFVFHGNVNKKIAATEPGEIGGEIRVNSSNVGEYVTYSQPTLKLKKGDIIYYWVYVQQDLLGYRKDGQQWEVTELRSQSGNECKASTSQITGRTDICSESVVFEENFDQSNIDTTKWLVEQYIPDGPDYEFVVYKKDNDVAFLTGNSLAVKPKLQDQKELTKETLDISNGCTRQGESCKRTLFVRHNPVISGRLVSHTMFRYGEFEIKAKLPTGDWMYPEIYLEGDNDQKLFIAYARGNEELTSKEGINIGAGLLYGGPALHPTEPRRSEKLSSHRGNGLFTADFHIYKVVWTPNQIELFVDGNKYGLINTDSLRPSAFASDSRSLVRLVLGVGVGGITDFPDQCMSKTHAKPWRNRSRDMLITFYNNKTQWYDGTWNANSQLQVDYVKVRAL